jgi:RimJ/RimL family protein N-acetyltransferase
MASALTRVAFEVVGMRRVELHIDTRNVPSQAVARKLGFTHEATLPARVDHPQGVGDRMIFTLHRPSYAGSPASSIAIEAYGATGERIL